MKLTKKELEKKKLEMINCKLIHLIDEMEEYESLKHSINMKIIELLNMIESYPEDIEMLETEI